LSRAVIYQSGSGYSCSVRKNALFHRRRVTAFLIDETYIRIGKYEAWVWIAIEPVHRYILLVYMSYHKNIMVA